MNAIITILTYIGMAAIIAAAFGIVLGLGYILIDFSMNMHFNSGGLPARKFAVIYFKGLRRSLQRHFDHLRRNLRKKA